MKKMKSSISLLCMLAIAFLLGACSKKNYESDNQNYVVISGKKYAFDEISDTDKWKIIMGKTDMKQLQKLAKGKKSQKELSEMMEGMAQLDKLDSLDFPVIMDGYGCNSLYNANGDNADTNRATREIKADNIRGIRVETTATIHYTPGNTHSVTVKGRPEHLDRMITKMDDGVLSIAFKPGEGIVSCGSILDVYITAPTIETIAVVGVCTFIADKLTAHDLTITNSGSLRLNVKEITCHTITEKLSGVTKQSDCKIKASRCTINSSGVSHVDISFEGESLSASYSGTGKAKFHVNCQKLEINGSGKAAVELSGVADNVKLDTSGIIDVDTSKLNAF